MRRAKCQRCGKEPAKAPHLPLCERCLYEEAMRVERGREAGGGAGNVVRMADRKGAR